MAFSAPSDWLSYARDVKAKLDPFEGAGNQDASAVNTYTFWKEYAHQTPQDALTCLGNSSCISGWLRNGNASPEQRSFVNVNFGSMGDDIPLAEGVAAASGKPVNIVCGDGAFMMNSQELATVMHNRLPIRIVVFSNGGYGSLSRTWKRYFNGVSAGCDASSGISFPSFAKLSDAYGIPYRLCATNADVAPSVSWLLSQTGPVLLEVVESPEPAKSPA